MDSWKIVPMFAWFDFWVGLFWDQRKHILYVFPVPMFGFRIEMRRGDVKRALTEYELRERERIRDERHALWVVLALTGLTWVGFAALVGRFVGAW